MLIIWTLLLIMFSEMFVAESFAIGHSHTNQLLIDSSRYNWQIGPSLRSQFFEIQANLLDALTLYQPFYLVVNFPALLVVQ